MYASYLSLSVDDDRGRKGKNTVEHRKCLGRGILTGVAAIDQRIVDMMKVPEAIDVFQMRKESVVRS